MSTSLEHLGRPNRTPDFVLGGPDMHREISYWEAKPGQPGVIESIVHQHGVYQDNLSEPHYDTRQIAKGIRSGFRPLYEYLGLAVHGIDITQSDHYATRAVTLHPENYVPWLGALSPHVVDFTINTGDTYSRWTYARNWAEGRATVATRRVGQAHDLHAHVLPAFAFMTPRAVEAVGGRAAFALAEDGDQLKRFMDASDFGLHWNGMGSGILKGLEGVESGWQAAARSISVVAQIPGRPVPEISPAELKTHARQVISTAQTLGPVRYA
jgi:hypothetical protein